MKFIKCIINLIRYRRLLKQGLEYEIKLQEERMFLGEMKLRMLKLKGEEEYWM